MKWIGALCNFAHQDRTSDQHDAYSVAAWPSRTDRDGELAGFLNPNHSPPERTLAQVEGWILGVPGLIRAGKKCDDPSPSTARGKVIHGWRSG